LVVIAPTRHPVNGYYYPGRQPPRPPDGRNGSSGVHFIALLRKIVGGVEEVCASVSQRVPCLPRADCTTAILLFDTTDHIGDMMNWTQI
jgi:hypothetical protein